MLVLRFFLTLRSVSDLGRAQARGRIRVLAVLKQPSLEGSDSFASRGHDHRNSTLTVLGQSFISRLDPKLAFESHSAPRPPQTPAASS